MPLSIAETRLSPAKVSGGWQQATCRSLQRDVAMRRNEDCRNFYAVAYEMLLKLQTVHFRHLEIDNQAVRKTGRQRREKFLSRSVSPGTKSVRTQQPAQGLEHGWIIVHNGNPWGSFRHERLLPLRRAPVELALGPTGTFSLFRQIELLGHANEVGDGSNAQFLHHPAAVDLDGLFDRTQFAGNLLVEPSRHDMRKHFAFARGQGRCTFACIDSSSE